MDNNLADGNPFFLELIDGTPNTRFGFAVDNQKFRYGVLKHYKPKREESEVFDCVITMIKSSGYDATTYGYFRIPKKVEDNP